MTLVSKPRVFISIVIVCSTYKITHRQSMPCFAGSATSVSQHLEHNNISN